MQRRIYVLGSLNMDLSIKTNNIPKLGETIVGSAFQSNPGGKGLNQAVASKKLKGDVYFLGAIGDDIFGQKMINYMDALGVNISKIKTVKNVSSGIAIIMVENANNRIILDLGANQTIENKDIDSFLASAREEDIFLTQLENNIDATGYALKKAKEKKMFTIVNPAPANKKILDFSNYIDLLTPNEIEINDLTSCGNNYHQGYKELNIPYLLITLGSDGCLFFSKGGNSDKYNTIKVDAVDSTGAGDTFNGALTAFIARGFNYDNAIQRALYAASMSVTKRGSSISSPTEEELNLFMTERGK